MNAGFNISGEVLLIGAAIGLVLLLAFILGGRALFNKRADSGLAEKYRGRNLGRNKYPEVDVFRYRPLFLRLGLIGVLAFTIAAFNWTSFPKKAEFRYDSSLLDFDVEVEPPPATAEAPPPPPPPPPSTIEEVPDEVLIEEDVPDFVDQSVDAATSIDAPVVVERVEKAVAPPPPPPKPAEPEIDEIFKVVEEMPRFPGCENFTTLDERKACADQKLIEYIYENIQYPSIARENNIQGTVVVRFVVNRDGKVMDAEVVRDIGGGCGQEALRVVMKMNDLPQRWTPGKQRGRAVNVMFSLPVRFKLENRT